MSKPKLPNIRASFISGFRREGYPDDHDTQWFDAHPDKHFRLRKPVDEDEMFLCPSHGISFNDAILVWKKSRECCPRIAVNFPSQMTGIGERIANGTVPALDKLWCQLEYILPPHLRSDEARASDTVNSQMWDFFHQRWLIPHVAPRDHGLICVSLPILPRDFDVEAAPYRGHEVRHFLSHLAGLYHHHQDPHFVVPWGWLTREALDDERAKMIQTIAEARPTIVCGGPDQPHVAARFLRTARVGLIVSHRPHVATVVSGDEPGWTVSICQPHWTLVNPYPVQVWKSGTR